MEERVGFRCYVTFVSLTCLASICKVSSSPVETSKTSMLQKIAVCDTVNFVKNSSYISKCNKLAYTTVLNEEDKDLAMCMVVYDITSKICSYNSQAKVVNSIKVPESSQQFDSDVKKLEPKPEEYRDFIDKFCKNKTAIFNRLNGIDIDSSADVVPFIKYVNETLLQQTECDYTCHGVNHRVNSFCMFFWWANELFSNVKKPIQVQANVEETLSGKVPPASVTDTQKQTLPQITKTVVIEPKKKMNSESNDETPVKVENPSIHAVDKSLPATDTKTKEEAKQLPDVSNNNQLVEKPKETKLEKPITEVKEESMPLSVGNDKTSSVASKIVDNNDEGLNIVQPEKANPEDFNSAEDPLLKKPDDIDTEDANIRDNTDDKDSMDDGNFVANNNMGNLAEISDNKKYYAHSSLVKEEDESHFFTYFSVLSLICVGLYVGYHNKQKILAMVLEGRRSRRGRGSRRRPSTASYRKLDSNLEEAVTSQCNSNVTHVIY